jgi:hypothetical protein
MNLTLTIPESTQPPITVEVGGTTELTSYVAQVAGLPDYPSTFPPAIGSAANQAVAGNDSRLTNSRTPTAHKSTHATGGADAITPSDIGAMANTNAAVNAAMESNSNESRAALRFQSPTAATLPRTNRRLLEWTGMGASNASYPWYKPLKVLAFGDSLIEGNPAMGLERVWGDAGFTEWRAQDFTGGAASVTDGYAFWLTGRYTAIPSGGVAVFAYGGPAKTLGSQASRICVGYIKESGAGSFTVDYSRDGGSTWEASLTTINASNASTIGAWYESAISMSPLIKIRITASGGPVKIINAGGWEDGGAGVVGSTLFARGGLNLSDQFSDCPPEIYKPIIAGFNPDMIVQCFHDWDVEIYDPAGIADGFAENMLEATRYTSPLSSVTTALTGTNNDLVFTAIAESPEGYPPSVGYVNPATPNAALSVSVTNGYIRVSLATNGSSVITSTAAQVKTAIEGNAPAAALITVANAAGNDGSGVVTAMADVTIHIVPPDWIVIAKNPEFHRTDETIETVDIPLLRAYAERNRLQFWDGFSIFGGFKKGMRDGLLAASGIGDPHPTDMGYLFRSQRFTEDVIAACVGKSGKTMTHANLSGLDVRPEVHPAQVGSAKSWLFGLGSTTSNTVRFVPTLISDGSLFVKKPGLGATSNTSWISRGGLTYDAATNAVVLEIQGGDTTWRPHVDGARFGTNGFRWEIAGLSISASYRSTAATITTQTWDHTIEVTANNVTINLRTAVGHNRIHCIVNSGAGTVTIDGNAAETIGGSATKTLTAGQRCTLQSTGANWIVLSDS